MSEPQDQKLVEVTLAKPHTHAGVAHDAKARIKVTASDREWLITQGVVNAPTAPKESAK